MNLLRQWSRVVLALVAAGSVLGASPERVQITLLSTTDLHGHIYPIDYGTDQPSADGLAKVGTLIRAIRREASNVLLMDSGDTIQGTPLVYYHNRVRNAPPDPMMLAMNALKYDALTIGNHEYNFGLDVLNKARHEAQFPWLSANTLRAGTEEPAYPPYIVKSVNGVRVGILGLTTPGVPGWENAVNYAGLTFSNPIESARKLVTVLREKERVDLLVIAMHMGLEESLATGLPSPGQLPLENAALAIARTVPGIDIIFMGHTHRDVPALWVNGALMAQANRWGDRLIRADVYLERDSSEAAWQVIAKTSASLPVTLSTPADPEILALTKSYHDETEAWLARPIGRSAKALTAADSRVRDTAIMDLVQRVQLDAGKADVSFAANFNLDAALPEGDVTVRNISQLYIYENTLVTIEATGAQIRAALEHAARYFKPYQPGANATQLIDPAIPGYNFDLAEGVDYTIDLTRPPGSRIVKLDYQGAPLPADRKLRVAINNYRVNGGGGYTMFRDAPVLERSSEEIRNLIIRWVEAHRDIPTEPTNNWRIVGE